MRVSDIIAQLIPVVRSAGQVILDIYHSDDLEIQSKYDNSPLTLADQAANEVICTALRKITPDILIISEENKAIDYTERKNCEYLWMVDPLDGTKEFIKKNGEFTINVALIHHHESIAGIVYAPVTGQMCYAIKDEGAYKLDNSTPHVLKCNSFSFRDPGLRVVCSRSHLSKDTQAYLDALNTPTIVSKGSSLKFLIIAEGEAELYPRLAPTMEWDTAAAHIILTESGGKITQLDGTSPLKYNKKNLLNPHFIAKANERS